VRASLSLAWRELVRFYRQRGRVVSALATPLVFWLLIGSGLGSSFAGGRYLEYLFPGTLLLVVMFTSIFSTISVIEDRREGFLQAVLVSPAPRWAVVLGKALGGGAVAFLQGMVFLALAPLAGMKATWAGAAGAAGVVALLALGLSSLGLAIAWRMDSTQGFHAVMNLFLMPMWLLSGALFPASGAAGWLRWVMRADPLSYGLGALTSAMAGAPSAADTAVTAGFAAASFAAACAAAMTERRGGA
jgi:ABC-2 type transport system permease protein